MRETNIRIYMEIRERLRNRRSCDVRCNYWRRPSVGVIFEGAHLNILLCRLRGHNGFARSLARCLSTATFIQDSPFPTARHSIFHARAAKTKIGKVAAGTTQATSISLSQSISILKLKLELRSTQVLQRLAEFRAPPARFKGNVDNKYKCGSQNQKTDRASLSNPPVKKFILWG